MSATVNMWLGILFLVLAIAAVILQAWLWKFPLRVAGDPTSGSTAPRSWTNAHRVIGLGYVIIYVMLMLQMVPRLWQYQVELPARTVMHATMGIGIGVVLIVKICIIRFFKHLEESLPQLGFSLLVGTVILVTFSVPFAFQASDIGGKALESANLERVKVSLATIPDFSHDPAAIATVKGLTRGKAVLVNKCTSCHDLKTILEKPRAPKSWHSVTLRMLKKPNIGTPITDEDAPYVTAYLIAITHDVQESLKEKAREASARQESLKGLGEDEEDDGENGEEVVETTTPDETTPDGTTPDGTAPDGTTPDGTMPDGTMPDGTMPDGTMPDGTTPAPQNVTITLESKPSGAAVYQGDKKLGQTPYDHVIAANTAPGSVKLRLKKDGYSSKDLTLKEIKNSKLLIKLAKKKKPFDAAKIKPIYEEVCSQCHGLDDIDAHGKDSKSGWRKVVVRMIEDNEMEIDKKTANNIIKYLAATKGK